MPGKKRIYREALSQITLDHLKSGRKLGTRKVHGRDLNGKLAYDEEGRPEYDYIDEKMERKEDLRGDKLKLQTRSLVTELDELERSRLYYSDGRLARRSPQEIFSKRKIEGVELSDISPSAAWKEAVLDFKQSRSCFH